MMDAGTVGQMETIERLQARVAVLEQQQQAIAELLRGALNPQPPSIDEADLLNVLQHVIRHGKVMQVQKAELGNRLKAAMTALSGL